jgi:hypothetical protein
LAASLVAGFALPAPAQVAWSNYMDTSMINEIVVHDGLLYMATYGGLVLYDIGRGEFEQFANINRMPSNQLRCLTFDDDDNLYVGNRGLRAGVPLSFSNGAPSLVRSNAQIDGLSSNTINAISNGGPTSVRR